MLDFTDRVVIVTGSGGGIGRAVALLFAQRGAKVAVNSVRKETGEGARRKIAEETGRECLFVQGDVSRPEAARELVERTVGEFGKIDILVNNAGIVLCGSVEEMEDEEFDRILRVNVKSALLMSKYAAPEIRAAGGGAIVNMASCIAFRGQAKRAAYAATKGALVSLTRSMAVDLLPDGIRVNCVCPGAVYTEKMDERFLFEGGGDPEKGREYYNKLQPIGRLGKDSEIAAAVLFAACEEASYMVGSPVIIDGGRTM